MFRVQGVGFRENKNMESFSLTRELWVPDLRPRG